MNMQPKFQQSLPIDRQWRCLFRSSTECWTLLVCTALVVHQTVESPQLQFLAFVVVPVLCNDKFLVQTVLKIVESPQVQLLWCCGVNANIQLIPAVQSYVSRAIQFDRVPDIPVTLTVQFFYKVVDTVAYDSCPWFDSAEQLRSPTTSSTSQFQNSGSASDSVIDRAQ